MLLPGETIHGFLQPHQDPPQFSKSLEQEVQDPRNSRSTVDLETSRAGDRPLSTVCSGQIACTSSCMAPSAHCLGEAAMQDIPDLSPFATVGNDKPRIPLRASIADDLFVARP